MYTLQYNVDEVIMFKQQQYTRQGIENYTSTPCPKFSKLKDM